MNLQQPCNAVGRGSSLRTSGRFEAVRLEHDAEVAGHSIEPGKIPTELFDDDSRSIVSSNSSPDLHFSYSLNPYRGCTHGCSYCYARPTHEYFGFGPGLDFETKIVVKRNASDLFRQWMNGRKKDEIEPVMLSGVTDCYQPVEKEFSITRRCIEAALEYRHPIQIITKNSLVRRDLDLLEQLAELRLANVAISLTTLEQSLTRVMEPRTSSPESRFETIAMLSDRGIEVTAMLAPIIPAINDHEIPQILQRAAEAGARAAGYTILRLPLTVQPVFDDWLEHEFPDRAEKVRQRIRALRQGKLNSSQFKERMTGVGFWAEGIRNTFRTFATSHGLAGKPQPLRTDLFRVVNRAGQIQQELF